MKNEFDNNSYLNIKKEKSSGAIVYKFLDNEIFFLIVKHNKGHISFPKGHLESRESEEDAAMREVMEETGITIKLDTKFKEISTYSPKEGVIKDVVFFVGEFLSGVPTPQDSEIAEVLFLKYEDAKSLITYENDINILDKAYKCIVSNINNM